MEKQTTSSSTTTPERGFTTDSPLDLLLWLHDHLELFSTHTATDEFVEAEFSASFDQFSAFMEAVCEVLGHDCEVIE